MILLSMLLISTSLYSLLPIFIRFSPSPLPFGKQIINDKANGGSQRLRN